MPGAVLGLLEHAQGFARFCVFSYRYYRLDAVPHDFMASALMTQPSPQIPHFIFCEQIMVYVHGYTPVA